MTSDVSARPAAAPAPPAPPSAPEARPHLAPWRDTALPAADRARLLTAALTLEEKAAQLGSVWLTDTADDFAPRLEDAPQASGFTDGLGQLTRVFGSEPLTVPQGVARLRRLQDEVVASQRLGIPALAHEECLTGLAAYGATAFPTPLAWAATFDEALVARMASAIGADMRALGIHQGLAPVLDVVRDYRWGRVEETLGEDPYLVGQLGAAYVAGLESAGVVATLKHFAGYAASRGARNHGPVSMGPRELADLVLPPFETALRQGGARSVMASYTDVDGVPCTANRELLTGVLRDRWGFEGTVVADYWAIPFLTAMHHVAADSAGAAALALGAGVDVELPQTVAYASLPALVRSGAVAEADVDRAVERHLRHKIEAGLLDGGPAVPDGAELVDLDSPRTRAVSARIAEESLVLLREDGVLPLRRGSRVALVGPAAAEFRSLIGCYAFPNHVLTKHPGHDLGVAIPTVHDALVEELGDAVSYAPGCAIGHDDLAGLDEAVDLARGADVAVVVVGDVAGLFGDGTSGEGCDVADLRLPGGQHELVTAVLATGVPTVVVVLSGRPYALGAYEAAGAMVQAFFPGADGAAAVAGLLTGRVRPTGRLPVQIPRHPSGATTYLEPQLGGHNPGISTLDTRPLFPFGFGLTDGDVAYRALGAPASVPTTGTMDVDVTVHNRGADTVEVVQLYASYPVTPVVRPVVQLVGFARLDLAAGATRTVRFHLDAARLAVTGVDGTLGVEPGTVVLSAGPSAADLPVTGRVEVAGPRSALRQRSSRTDWSVVEASA